MQCRSEWSPLRLKAFSLLILLFSVYFLYGCTGTDKSKLSSSPNHNRQPPKKDSGNMSDKWKLPIKVPEGEIFNVSGWVSTTEIIYTSNVGNGSNVYKYNMMTGNSKLFYKSDLPIVTVQISPDKKYILIHSAPSTYEGRLTILDQEGREVWNKSIPSFELSFEWNQYNNNELLISAFNEDWTYKVYHLDLGKKDLKELTIPQPFIKWVNEESIAYLNWDNNSPSLFAPLVIKKIGDRGGKIVFPEVFQFASFKDTLLTITVNEQDKSNADYSFYDSHLKSVFSFSIPQLTKFSDWLVPFNDYNEKKHQFLTFKPLRSGEADTYNEGFQLVVYNLRDKNDTQLLLEGMENAPILYDPSGDFCLYGNRFEKLIDLKSKKVYKLIAE